MTPNDESPPGFRGTFAVQAADFRGDLMERVTGIEPALSAWEADVLPLNYTRVLCRPQVCRMPGGRGPLGKGGDDIRVVEVLALEQQGATFADRQCVGEAVAQVQACGMA